MITWTIAAVIAAILAAGSGAIYFWLRTRRQRKTLERYVAIEQQANTEQQQIEQRAQEKLQQLAAREAQSEEQYQRDLAADQTRNRETVNGSLGQADLDRTIDQALGEHDAFLEEQS